MKNPFIIIALAVVLVLVVLILLGAAADSAEWTEAIYIVQPGDTLYSIAADLGVSDWRRWSYEVCRLNGITDGGLLTVGEEIIIYEEGGG